MTHYSEEINKYDKIITKLLNKLNIDQTIDNDKLEEYFNTNNSEIFILLQNKRELNNFKIIYCHDSFINKIELYSDYNIILDYIYFYQDIDLLDLIYDKISQVNKKYKQKINNSYLSLSEKKQLISNPLITVKNNNIYLNFQKFSKNNFIELINWCVEARQEYMEINEN
jgi:hypothetical protein